MPTTPQEAQEIERKYEAPHTGEVPLNVLSGALRVGTAETFELHASYFDTPDLTLKSHGIAVRRRTGGSDAGWHIKHRREGRVFETAWPDAARVPGELLATLKKVTGEDITVLRPVATVRNTRTKRLLRDSADEPVAEMVDDRVQAHHHLTNEHRSWREWEVELVGHQDEHLLEELEPELRAVGAYPSLSASKVGRATGALRTGAARPEHSANTMAACAVTDTVDLLAGANPEDPRIAQLRELARTLATS